MYRSHSNFKFFWAAEGARRATGAVQKNSRWDSSQPILVFGNRQIFNIDQQLLAAHIDRRDHVFAGSAFSAGTSITGGTWTVSSSNTWGAEVGKWLRSVVAGHNRYYGVPANLTSLKSFRFQVVGHWRWALRRRSQKTRLTWEQMRRLADRWLPPPTLHHPYPLRRLGVIT